MLKDLKRYTPVPLAFKCSQPDAKVQDTSPIIFLHGVTSCKKYWKNIPQEVAHATKRKVYTIDARNHGDSEWNEVFNFDSNVDDLLHFMDYIQAPKATLVGHSMGGITAIKMALREPERVEKIVVEDIYVKKVPKESLDMVLEMISVAKAALLQVPKEVDECTAMKIIADYMNENVTEFERQRRRKY